MCDLSRFKDYLAAALNNVSKGKKGEGVFVQSRQF